MRTIGVRPVPALVAVIACLVGALAFVSLKAFAATTPRPTFSSGTMVTQAKFHIPDWSHQTWTLNLWSHGQLLGTASGTSGSLVVPLTSGQSCGYQADVRKTGRNGASNYFAGARATSSCCPTSTS
jgi:hypothetical protein